MRYHTEKLIYTSLQLPQHKFLGGGKRGVGWEKKGYNLDRLWSEGGRQAYKAPGNTFEDPYSVANHMFVMRGTSSKKHKKIDALIQHYAYCMYIKDDVSDEEEQEEIRCTLKVLVWAPQMEC